MIDMDLFVVETSVVFFIFIQLVFGSIVCILFVFLKMLNLAWCIELEDLFPFNYYLRVLGTTSMVGYISFSQKIQVYQNIFSLPN